MKTWARVLTTILLIAIAAVLYGFLVFAPDDKLPEVVGLAGSHDDLNPYILEVIREYPSNGQSDVLPVKERNESFGTTKDIYYQGRKIISGDPQGRSYCCGLLFEVYMEAWKRANGDMADIGGMTVTDIYQFRRDFYGFDGNRRTFVRALEDRKLGIVIEDHEDAKPGDLVQFWRNNGSGHSVVFLEWQETKFGESMVYWSVQNGTGISTKTESIGESPNQIKADELYIIRGRN